jgi:hypothetical protein
MLESITILHGTTRSLVIFALCTGRSTQFGNKSETLKFRVQPARWSCRLEPPVAAGKLLPCLDMSAHPVFDNWRSPAHIARVEKREGIPQEEARRYFTQGRWTLGTMR